MFKALITKSKNKKALPTHTCFYSNIHYPPKLKQLDTIIWLEKTKQKTKQKKLQFFIESSGSYFLFHLKSKEYQLGKLVIVLLKRIMAGNDEFCLVSVYCGELRRVLVYCGEFRRVRVFRRFVTITWLPVITAILQQQVWPWFTEKRS